MNNNNNNNFIFNTYKAKLDNDNDNDLLIFNKILDSFFEIYLKLSNIINENPNNNSVKKWSNLKDRKKYLEIFSNIITYNDFYQSFNTTNNLNLNKYISKALHNEIKFAFYKKTHYSNQFNSNNNNIKISYIDAHGAYIKNNLIKLPKNIIVCHITPVNRFSTLSSFNRNKLVNTIFNKDNINIMLNNGISCFKKNMINNDLFQYTQIFYNLCPELSISLETNPSSSLYKETAVYFNKSGNKYDFFLNKYNESTSEKKSSTLKSIIELISKKYPNKYNILFFNTCRNIDYDYKKFNNLNFYNNTFINNIYIYEKVLSILNYAIDKCYENKFIKNKNISNNSVIYPKYSNKLYNLNHVFGNQFTKYYKNKLLENVKYKDKFLSPSINYFWITILLYHFDDNGIIHEDININDEYINNQRLIEIAISQNNYYITKILFNNNPNINNIRYKYKFNKILDKYCYNTLLNIAMTFNNIDIIKLLIKHNYEITFKDLIDLFINICISSNNLSLLKKLIRNGYSNGNTIKQISNNNKSNILNIANKNNNRNIINLLKKNNNENNFILNMYKRTHDINNNNIYRSIKKIGTFNYLKSKIIYSNFKKILNKIYGFYFLPNNNIVHFLIYSLDTKKYKEISYRFPNDYNYCNININNIFIKDNNIYLFLISYNDGNNYIQIYELNNFKVIQTMLLNKPVIPYLVSFKYICFYPNIIFYENKNMLFSVNLEEAFKKNELSYIYFINSNYFTGIKSNIIKNYSINNNILITYSNLFSSSSKKYQYLLSLVNLSNSKEFIIYNKQIDNFNVINNRYIIFNDTKNNNYIITFDTYNYNFNYYSINEIIIFIKIFDNNKILIYCKENKSQKKQYFLYVLEIYKDNIILSSKLNTNKIINIIGFNSKSFLCFDINKDIILSHLIDDSNKNSEKNNNISKIININLNNNRYTFQNILLSKENFRKKYHGKFKKQWDIALNYSKKILHEQNNISKFDSINNQIINNKILNKLPISLIDTFDDNVFTIANNLFLEIYKLK